MLNVIYLKLKCSTNHTNVANGTTFQMEKYAHCRNGILGIVEAHHNIGKTRPSNVNCGNINAIAMGPTLA